MIMEERGTNKYHLDCFSVPNFSGPVFSPWVYPTMCFRAKFLDVRQKTRKKNVSRAPRTIGTTEASCQMCQGLNSHYFHIIGDGHQPNSRGLYTHYKDSYKRWDDHPQYSDF